MKVLKLEIETMGDQTNRNEWYRRCDRMKQLTNRVWQLWELGHVWAGSGEQVVEYLDKLGEWKKTKSGDKPKCPVQAITNEAWNKMYHDLRQHFPDLNTRVVVLAMNILRGKIIGCKSQVGNLPGWMAILLNHQGRPSSIHPQPIPFDKANSRIEKRGDEIVCVVRVDRIEVPGKKMATSTESEFVLKAGGRARRYAAPIRDIAAGSLKFCGSQIVYDKGRRKWFAMIAYEPAAKTKASLDAERTAYIRPAKNRPWLFRTGGYTRWLGPSGEFIGHRRRHVLLARWQRQENYRTAAPPSKGHGLNRALASPLKLQRSWNCFAKTVNQTLAFEAATRCVELGIGKIVLFIGERCGRRGRFLSHAGKVEGRRDATAWAWFQFSSLLQQKCQEMGIELEIRGEHDGVKTAAGTV